MSTKPLKKLQKGRILVLKEKHDTRYFDISTDDKLHAVALKIVKERIDPRYGYIQDPGPLAGYTSVEEYDPTDEELAALPPALRPTAHAKRDRWRREKRDWTRDKQVYNDAKAAVKAKDGRAAWVVLQSRVDYEYEGYEFDYLENA